MDDESRDLELPRAVALAWGVSANPQRGPKRELNIERIVEAAVAIADEKGISAVSMASVATALGFTTMSLYRYVSAKDDLILLMQETGIGLPPLAIAEAEDWREGLRLWYREILAVYIEHPWLLDIPITGTPNTPNNLAWMDAGLGALRDTTLDPGSRISAVLLLSGQSRWQAMLERNVGGSEQGMDDERMLAQLITPAQFPYLYPAMQAGAFADDDDPFEFGISRILDGLDHRMAELSSGVAAAPAVRPAEPGREFAKDEGVKKARQLIKEAEGRLREARKREREALAKAAERAKN